jgi:hypothetical protein
MSLNEYFEPLIKCCMTCGEQTHLTWDATDEEKKAFGEWGCSCKKEALLRFCDEFIKEQTKIAEFSTNKLYKKMFKK